MKRKLAVLVAAIICLGILTGPVKSGMVYKNLRTHADTAAGMYGDSIVINMSEGGFNATHLMLYIEHDSLGGTGSMVFTPTGYLSPGFLGVNDGFGMNVFNSTGSSSGTAAILTSAPAGAYLFHFITGGVGQKHSASQGCYASYVIIKVTGSGFTTGNMRLSYTLYED